MKKRKTLLAWSSGKDCAWALHKLLQDPQIDVAGLFCTVNKALGRVSMHGVRIELLRQQANSIGLPLEIIKLPDPCGNDEYIRLMGDFVAGAQADNIECFAFGDLFLEDVRDYRIAKLAGSGIEAVFPLWDMPTDILAREMIDGGLKTIITCVNPELLPEKFIGREFDNSFLKELPKGVDPCGENGEFHSFVFDAPMFNKAVKITVGDITRRDNSIIADILSI